MGTEPTPTLHRRRLLTAVGAGIAGLAGCLGDAPDDVPDDAPTTGSGGTDTTTAAPTTDPGSASATTSRSESCADLRGSYVEFDPGDRAFTFAWDVPDTWEEYNEEISSTEELLGAMLGHVDTARSASYPNNVVLLQRAIPVGEEGAGAWLDYLGQTTDDGTVSYGGEELRRTTFADDDDTSGRWHLELPDGEDYYALTVQATAQTVACYEGVEAIAYDVMDTFRPRR